jgi:hypothetical protein
MAATLFGIHHSTRFQRWLTELSISHAQHATFGFVGHPVQERGFLLVWFCEGEPSVSCCPNLISVDHAEQILPFSTKPQRRSIVRVDARAAG